MLLGITFSWRKIEEVFSDEMLGALVLTYQGTNSKVRVGRTGNSMPTKSERSLS